MSLMKNIVNVNEFPFAPFTTLFLIYLLSFRAKFLKLPVYKISNILKNLKKSITAYILNNSWIFRMPDSRSTQQYKYKQVHSPITFITAQAVANEVLDCPARLPSPGVPSSFLSAVPFVRLLLQSFKTGQSCPMMSLLLVHSQPWEEARSSTALIVSKHLFPRRICDLSEFQDQNNGFWVKSWSTDACKHKIEINII